MFTYCLFCETGKCRFVAHEVMSTLENCLAISPRQIQHTWQNGKMVDRPVVIRAERTIALALAAGVLTKEDLQ